MRNRERSESNQGERVRERVEASVKRKWQGVDPSLLVAFSPCLLLIDVKWDLSSYAAHVSPDRLKIEDSASLRFTPGVSRKV